MWSIETCWIKSPSPSWSPTAAATVSERSLELSIRRRLGRKTPSTYPRWVGVVFRARPAETHGRRARRASRPSHGRNTPAQGNRHPLTLRRLVRACTRELCQPLGPRPRPVVCTRTSSAQGVEWELRCCLARRIVETTGQGQETVPARLC